jgi:hypothetical protein
MSKIDVTVIGRTIKDLNIDKVMGLNGKKPNCRTVARLIDSAFDRIVLPFVDLLTSPTCLLHRAEESQRLEGSIIRHPIGCPQW